MTSPQEQEFKVGDDVRLKDMSSPELNGQVGTLKKTVGAGKWAVVLRGQDKSKIVSTKNLEVHIKFDPESMTFHIVGTWDEWEAHAMTWDPVEECLAYEVVLGSKGEESFKILLEEDWDMCIYPAEPDASPHAPFELHGPDDGQDAGEWTIGKHPQDHGASGAAFRVKLFVDGEGTPERVTWSCVEPQRPEAPDPKRGSGVPAFARVDSELPVVTRSSCFDDETERDFGEGELPVVTRRGDRGGRQGLFALWQRDAQQEQSRERRKSEEKEMEERVIAQEKAARERLERRLEAAADLLRIEDGDAQNDEESGILKHCLALDNDVKYRLEVNKERFVAEMGG